MNLLNQHQLVESTSTTVLEPAYSYIERRTLPLAQYVSRWTPAELFRYRFLKRALDFFIVLLALPVLLPVFVLIAVFLFIDSPGPVFFSHQRIQRHGGYFSMWKFRTMCVNSSEVLEAHLRKHSKARREWLATHKLRHDPRITRFGAFLRRTSLDELPQIWNVLKGNMSLVGPRPIVTAEISKYGDKFQSYCLVKPGLTGLWQVSGRSKVSYQTRVDLDCRYVQEWSLWGDCVILFKTLSAVLKQDGAY